MKKALIIAHLRRASPRILGLAKFLPEFGWEPTILTASLDEKPGQPSRIVETPYRDVLNFWKRLFRLTPDEDLRREIKKRFGITSKKSLLDYILTLAGEIVNYPDGDKGWKPFAIRAGDELLQREDIDVIISSSSPVTSHLIARELKVRHKIPWIADLRDLWSQNHNYSYSPIRKWFDRRLELKTLSAADALITVSQPWANKLSTIHKGKTTYAITNGFDPETVNIPAVNLTTKFTITYTGAIYAEKHAPDKLFIALRDLISDRVIDPNDIEVRFYGTMADWLEQQVKQYGLANIVSLFGHVPKDVVLLKQRESQLLFLTKWQDTQERGAYSGKIFEYLAARRPILAAGGSDDVVTELLNETSAGVDAPTIQDIKDALQKLYRDYKHEGRVAYSGIGSNIDKYSYREMARKYAEILDKLAEK